jgi:tetratricopeptide (TPR) repeat protein
MAKSRFNWKFAIVLLLAVIVLGLTLFGLRNWRRQHMAQQGLKLGNQAYADERWEDAVQNLGRYINRHPDDVQVLMKYAQAQLNIRPVRRNQIQQALNAYRYILQIDKGNVDAASTLIEIYLQVNQPFEAEYVARQILPFADQTKFHIWLATAMIQQRKFDEATVELRSVIQKNPDTVSAYEIMAQLAQQRPELFPDDSAESWLVKAVKNNPDSVDAHLSRAAYYFKQNRKTDAAADVAKAETLNPTDFKILLRLSRAYNDMGDSKKAETCFLRAKEVAPKDIRIWQTAAWFAQQSRDPKQMADVAENAIRELGYYRWDFMPVAIELFVQADQLDRAQQCIDEIRREDIASVGLYLYEGLIADRRGQVNHAIDLWNKAVADGMKTPQIRQALASALWRIGDKASAIQHLRSAVAENPDNPDLCLELSGFLLQTGQWDQAVQQAQKARQLSPDNFNAVVIYYRALIRLYTETEPDLKSAAWKKVEKELSELSRNSPKESELKKLQFQLAVQSRDFAQAEIILSNWKTFDAAQWPTALAEAELLFARNEFAKADEKLRSAIRNYPETIEPAKLFAMLRADEKPEEVENILLVQIQNQTSSQKKKELVLLLASLYDRWRKQDNAANLLTTCENQYPDDIQIQRQLLRYRQVVDNSDRAQKIIDRIKSIEGENGWQWRYEQAKFWLSQGNVDKSQKPEKYQQILTLLKDNLRLNPENLENSMLLAYAYRIGGEFSMAVATYRDCYNRQPNQLAVILPMVAVMQQIGEYEQADEIINRAAQQQLVNPLLSRFELQGHLVMGEIDTSVQILQNLLRDDPKNREYILMLASLKTRQGRFEEAESMLNQLNRDEPDSMPVAVQLINLKIEQGKNDQAVALCDQLVEKNKNAAAWLIRAQTRIRLGLFEDAQKDINQVIAMAPDSVEGWIAKSDLHNRKGQLDDAVQAARQAMSLTPENLEIQKRVISLYLNSNRPELIDQGKNLLEKALQDHPNDADFMLQRVRFLISRPTRPNLEQAKDILKKIEADNPKNVDVWLLHGDLALREGQPGNAIDLALHGLTLLPNNKNLLLLKARAEKPSSLIMTISTLKTLNELYPGDIDIVLQLADSYLLSNDAKKAKVLLDGALSNCQDKNRRILQIAGATADYHQGNRENALKELDSLAAAAPEDPYPILTQARLLAKDRLWPALIEKLTAAYQNRSNGADLLLAVIGDLMNSSDPDAMKSAQQILSFLNDREPKNIISLKMQATLFLNDDKTDDAAALYRKVLELNPNDSVACNNLAWIISEKQNDFKDALKLINQGLEKSPPEYVDILDTRGMIFYRLEDYRKAFDDFNRCIELYPSWTPALSGAWFHMGLTLVKMDRNQEAVKCFKQALDLHKTNGGLSNADQDEAQRMVRKLSQGV